MAHASGAAQDPGAQRAPILGGRIVAQAPAAAGGAQTT
jgi:hypothetical protein